jgi:hypothetical protein
MVKWFGIDKLNGTVTLEVTKTELTNLMNSVDNMADKQKRTLLENLPSDEVDRRKLDDYEALKEGLRKVIEMLD